VEVDFNDLRPSTLLVVDDNQTNCDLMVGLFAGSHHKLFFCGSGQEAIVQARDLKPDIVLMDIRMPGMNGHDALAGIRKTIGLEMVPVIAVTASALLNTENSLKEQFSGYIRKPFSKHELFEELSDFLPRHTTGSKAGTDAPSSLDGAPSQPVPKELLSQLRALLVEPWPAIRDSVAVNESRVFAQGLEGLGQRWRCQPVVDYAQKLSRDAENYAVTDLEKHLGEFSVLVEQLEKASHE
jgi:CheY-like chemotaxis protein